MHRHHLPVAALAALLLAPAAARAQSKLDDPPPATAGVETREPAKLAAPPAPPAAPDRIRTIDGKEHLGRITGEIEHGYVFEAPSGAQYVIPFRQIEAIDRTGKQRATPAADGDARQEQLQRALGDAFDVYTLERERDRQTYGEKLLVTGLSAAAAVAGFALVRGEAGNVLGALGLAGTAVGGLSLAVTAYRRAELQEQLDASRRALAAPQAAREVRLTLAFAL